MSRCIVSIAADQGFPRYTRNLARMIRSLHDLEDPTPVVSWTNTFPKGSPPVKELPWKAYCAKPYAFLDAAEMGFTTILWLDASIYAVRPISEIFSHIETFGYYVQDNGFKFGQWCSDSALENLGYSREESLNAPEISTCAIGIDLTKEDGVKFLDKWCELAADGVTFIGAHANTAAMHDVVKSGFPTRTVGLVSDDDRVLGHRHDQTAASAIAHRLGWKGTPRPKFVDYWREGIQIDQSTLLLNDGR